jgi:hypothetical protein
LNWRSSYTMPAFVTDYFGAKQVGSIYGLMLRAWDAAALFGPTLVARVREATGHYQGARLPVPPSLRREPGGAARLAGARSQPVH